MTDLTPPPASLGLASPALGPWFQVASSDDNDLAPIGPPDADLGSGIALPDGAIWNAPANGLLSYFVASPTRPAALSTLRQANGDPAFADGAFILLFTLLPEVAARLGALTQAAPRADSSTAAAPGDTTRPVVNRLAIEITPGDITTIDALSQILPDKDAADLKTVSDNLASDSEKASFVGLTFNGGFSNAEKPATILRRPEKDDARLLENLSGGPLNVKLWAFDHHGRPYDAGALAALWHFLASDDDDGWDNLWATDDTDRQRTAGVVDSHVVHLVNAHEGPLEPPILARITGQLTDLTAIGPSTVLFTAGTNPAIGLTNAANAATDSAPLARLAPLPAGPYAPLDTATPFAGWSDPAALARDFLRVAITDIEAMTVGIPRTVNTAQGDPRRRVSPARNTASTVFLPTMDAVASAIMARLDANEATVQFIAPELDRLWGPQTPATLGGGDPFNADWDAPSFSAHALKGSGNVTASIAEKQAIVLHFDSSLPPDSWVRAWPHGRDTDSGRRFRMTGGAAKVDGSGSALVILPLPDGKNGDGTDDVRFSFDLYLVTDTGSRLYTDRRANRPAVNDSVSALAITAITNEQTLYCPQSGNVVDGGSGDIPPGAGIVVITGPVADRDFTALDPGSLRGEDMTSSVARLADEADRIITRDPAFVQTPPGDLPTDAVAGGPERVHQSSFHKTATGQEMYDLAAYDTTGNQGVVGALAARAGWHEAPPPALAHAGVSAAPEIHGQGVAVAGPAADALRLLMRERAPGSVAEFISTMGIPFSPAANEPTPGPWTALLETAAKGTHGHRLMSLIPTSIEPGEVWNDIKQQIDAALGNLPGGLTTDGLIDSNNFDDDTAAAAFDRVLAKHRSGAQGFARAAIAAISRAEDLVWLQSPALDNESFTHDDGNIYLLEALTQRLTDNPALHCLIIVPEKHLPDRNNKLEKVRKSAVGAALQALDAAAGDRVAWVSPIAGPGRAYHMGATTLIIDDAIMFSGAAHAWRRGLVFDSALTAALFDEQLEAGRPRTVAAARRLLAGNLLGIHPDFVPLAAPELIKAAKALNARGGFNRANPAAYTLKDDATSDDEKAIWNPAVSADTIWTAKLAELTGDLEDEFENGTR